MVLAPDAPWLRAHPGILPTLWYGAIFFGILAIFSTRWFRSLILNVFGGPSNGESKLVIHRTGGSNSTNFANTGAGTQNVNIGLAEQRLRTEMEPKIELAEWRGTLAAVCQSPLAVGNTGYVTASVLSEAFSGSEQMEVYSAALAKQGRLERTPVSFNFQKTNEKYRPAAVRVELVTSSPFVNCPKNCFDLDLSWVESKREVKFQVRATRPGNHIADVVLMVRKKHIASISLNALVDEDIFETEYERVAEVRVTIEIGRYLAREMNRELERDDLARDRDDYTGYDNGRSR